MRYRPDVTTAIFITGIEDDHNNQPHYPRL